MGCPQLGSMRVPSSGFLGLLASWLLNSKEGFLLYF